MNGWFERSGHDLAAARATVRAAFPDGAVELHAEGAWLALVDRGVAPATDASERRFAADLGLPGPWRLVPGRRGAVERCFEIPPRELLVIQDPAAAKEGDPAGQGGSRPSSFLLTEAVAWAAATSPRRADPPVATGPPDSGVDDELGLVLALGAPDLSAVRLAWVDRLAVDARRRWRLARVGRVATSDVAAPPDTGFALRAEVDLTAAPPALAAGYRCAGAESLRRAARWLRSSLELVLDTGIASAVLDRHSPRDLPLHPETQR